MMPPIGEFKDCTELPVHWALRLALCVTCVGVIAILAAIMMGWWK